MRILEFLSGKDFGVFFFFPGSARFLFGRRFQYPGTHGHDLLTMPLSSRLLFRVTRF